MQRELPTINFTTQAEVRSEAEHRRTEEIMELLRPILKRWIAGFHHRRHTIFNAVQYVHVSAGAGNRRHLPGKG